MSWAFVNQFGGVYGLLATPTFFAFSSVLWFFLGTLDFVPDPSNNVNSYLTQVGHGKAPLAFSTYFVHDAENLQVLNTSVCPYPREQESSFPTGNSFGCR